MAQDRKVSARNNPKTLRGRESRRKILETARHLIGQSDSGSVTLDQIADSCRISKSSILWHFGSKEELFLEVADMVFRDLEAIVSNYSPAGLSPAEKFEFFLQSYERMLEKDPEAPRIFFSFVFNSHTREKLNQRIREIYEWNRQAFCEQFGLSAARAVILLGMINGIVIQAGVHPEEISIREVFNEAASLLKDVL